MIKRFLAAFLSVCMVLALLPGTARAAATSGTFGAEGDNLTWTLDDEGLLTISGSGNMPEYTNNFSSPWKNYRNSIKNLQFGPDVTSIGGYTFCDCTGLTSVTIPGSVTSIGDSAFDSCSGLTSVTILDGVTSIGTYTFNRCTSLNSITIPGSVTSIGSSAFTECSSLTGITIPKGVTSIGGGAFRDCTNLNNVTIPEGVTSIGNSTFIGCTGLTSITIPDGVTSIGNSAFSGCSSLTNIAIPESVTSVGSGAFRGTPWISDQGGFVVINGVLYDYGGPTGSDVVITIPANTTVIGRSAFSSCFASMIIIPEGVTSIEEYAFFNATLGSLVIPCSVENIAFGALNVTEPGTTMLNPINYYYNGSTTRLKELLDLDNAYLNSSYTYGFYGIPTLFCDTTAIIPGAVDPVVTITSDMAFKEGIDTTAIEITTNTTGLELASVSLPAAARSGDNKTLSLQFTGTAQAGQLDLTVPAEAFADDVANINGPVNTVIPSITVAGPNPAPDPEPNDPVDPPEDPVLPPLPDPVYPIPAPGQASTSTPDSTPGETKPVVVAVEPTIDLHDPDPIVISGEGESEFQNIVKSGEYDRWIDRVDLPEYALDLYKVLCIGGDHDTLYDILIRDEYNTVSGGSGTASGEEADVESVLELTADLNLPYSSGSGIFSEGQFSDGFDVIDTTAGDKAIRYGELKEGDVVRTSTYNGIFVTSVPKDGNDSYDADLKAAAAYASTAFQAFDRDHPEVFWLSGKSKLRLVTVTMKDGSQKYKETYIFFILADKDGFTVRDSKYPSQSSIESDIQRLETAVTTILSTVTASAPNEQTAQLNRWLTEHNEYNRSEDLHALPNWPHECLSALVGSTGTEGPVCDGYSRAFKVLCDRLEIPCVLVDGYAKVSADSAGEFHMWNSAQMSDGQWYGVDVTWNDPTVKGVTGAKSGHEREDFLLVGADTVVMGLKFSVSHPPKNRAADGGVAFVNGPTLSTAAFNPLAAATVLPFTDVAAGSWYLSAVKYVYENDLMTGETASAFAPGGAMTRAMVWTVLGRMDGAAVNGGDPWYSGAQSWAVSAEVSDGANPNGRISREELVTMLWRTQGSPDTAADLSGFTDGGAVSSWASGAVQWAVSTGLLEGSAGKLDPSGSATRAEVAAILMRFCQTLQK